MPPPAAVSQYLSEEVDPYLRPILTELARRRPQGLDILKTIQELAQQAIKSSSAAYHPTNPQPHTPVHVFSDNTTQLPLCKKPEDVTREWLSQCMAAEVKSFEMIVNAQGQQGVCVIVKKIKYAEGTGSDRPESCAIKMHAQTDAQRGGCVAIQSYSTEMIFYEKLASTVPLKSPKCFAIVAQQAPKETRTNGEAVEYFNLVMQDLSVDYGQPGGTIENGMNFEQAKMALDAVSEIHLKFWTPIGEQFGAGHDPAYSKPPFVDLEGQPPFAFYQMFWVAFKDSWPACQKALLEYPGTKQFPGGSWPKKIAEIARMFDELAANDTMTKLWDAAAYCTDPSTNPTTFIHGDFNAGNIWVGTEKKDLEMMVADWQLGGRFVCGAEFPTLCGTAELKDGDDMKLAKWYWDKLCTRIPGVKDEWTFEQMLDGIFHMGTTFMGGYSYYAAAQAADLGSMTKEKADYSMQIFWPMAFVRTLRMLVGLGYKEWLAKLVKKVGG